MRELNLETVMAEAERLYANKKGVEGFRKLPSDQINALAEALINAINRANETDDED